MDTVWLTLRGVSPSIWSHSVDSNTKSLGRKSSCEIQLLHQSVSRVHAEVWLDEDKTPRVKDLNSSNGTCVNGTRVNDAFFAIGDVLQLGLVMLDVVQDIETEPVADVLLDRTTELRPGDLVPEGQSIDTIDMAEPSLSEAQLRVLRLLLTGQSEKQIAEKLFLSPHTVHSHVKQIYQYHNVNSRPALMAHFIDLAILDGNSE